MAKKIIKSNKHSKDTRRHTTRLVIGVIVAVVLVGIVPFVFPKSQNSFKPVEVSQDKSTGNADAPVVVVEYGDYQCPGCGRFAKSVKPKIVEEFVNTGQVRFVFRNFQFIGKESQWAAEAAECANEQGKFWEFYEKLYSEQAGENVGAFRKENLESFAGEVGLQAEQFNKCLASGKFTEKVNTETLEAENLGIRGTPSLFVNGELVEDGAKYEILSQKIRQVISDSK